jgi:hypothetical protein
MKTKILDQLIIRESNTKDIMDNYEDSLRRAYAEGWRDPVKVSVLEIEAYKAGMLTERKRVLSIFKDIADGRPVRAIDLGSYIEKIKKNPV